MAEFAPTVPRVDGDVFLVLAFDGDDTAKVRDEFLEGHLAYVEQHCDDYLICGPLQEPDEPALIGSFFLLVAENEAAARELIGGDPYMQSGMYAEVRVLAGVASAGRFMGGVIWESAAAIRAAVHQ